METSYFVLELHTFSTMCGRVGTSRQRWLDVYWSCWDISASLAFEVIGGERGKVKFACVHDE